MQVRVCVWRGGVSGGVSVLGGNCVCVGARMGSSTFTVPLYGVKFSWD